MSDGGFFADAVPRRRPQAPPYRTPPWLAPPDNVLPGTVALGTILARTERAAVWLTDGRAYADGLAFTVATRLRDPEQAAGVPFFDEDPADALRLGVVLADGTRVVAQGLSRAGPLHSEPPGAVLRPRGGGGGPGGAHAELWLWPLPAPGELTVVCAWAAAGIPETRVTLDASEVVAAAARAIELWPDDRPLPPAERDVVV